MKALSRLLCRQLLFVFTLVITFISVPVSAESAQEQSIHEPVIALHEALLQLMRNAESSSFSERYELLEPIIKQYFDTALISKVILGRYWLALDEEKQIEFIDLFNRLTISTYVNRFDSYSDETFNLNSMEQMKETRYMVKTDLLIPDKDNVSFNYIVQKNEGADEKWKIISVIAKGINDLALKRAEYSAVIQDKGYESLLTDIKEKISNLENK